MTVTPLIGNETQNAIELYPQQDIFTKQKDPHR